MSRDRQRPPRWQLATGLGGLVLFGWFALHAVRRPVVVTLQTWLLEHRDLIAPLPLDIAMPRLAVESLLDLGIPVAFLVLGVSLFALPRSPDDDVAAGGD